ncbi:MAG: DnaA regulatory inactivator Hda [Pseudomonadota bacterium]
MVRNISSNGLVGQQKYLQVELNYKFLTVGFFIALTNMLRDTMSMSSSISQQVFDFNLIPENTIETFYTKDSALINVLKNAAARELNELQLFFWGGVGSGKTHLLQAVCHIAQNKKFRVIYLPMSDVFSYSPEVLKDLNALDIVCIDDVHLISQRKKWEIALFDLINQMRAAESLIVMSSCQSPSEDIFDLADLNSRSTWGPVYKLPQLNDDDLKQVLMLHAKKSGLELSDEVCNYLLTRHKRDLSLLVKVLDKLTRLSLREQRKITIPFVKQVLSID